MTLEEFKKNHPDAYCSGDTEDADCHVYEGVSFAGVKATSDNSCRDFKTGTNHPIPDYCHAQGMRAEFADGKMVSLSYGVAKGMLPTVIEALKKQYGKPDNEKFFRVLDVRRHGLDINIPALKALAPTQSELPFLGMQVVVMLIFIVLEVLAARRFPAETVQAA